MSVARLLDANANRAREAMRVMEDAARFLLDDQALASSLKSLRHDFAQALQDLPMAIEQRDTQGDVGTTLTTPREYERTNQQAVVIAAGKRLTEALRAIEEFAKINAPNAANQIEQLRYRAYTIERDLTLCFLGKTAKQWKLCVLITEALCLNGDWLGVTKACIEGGADCLQLREKHLTSRELIRRTRELVSLARPKGVSVILNDRPDLALIAQADGVHLGQKDAPCDEVRKIVGSELLIGVSTGNLEQAQRAAEQGADYCGVGPMYETKTVDDKPEIAGASYLQQYVNDISLPHLAIGGITPANLPELVGAGVKGVAVSSVVCQADDPKAVAQQILAQLA